VRVDHLGIDGEGGVREQRPRRGGPAEQRDSLLPADREADVDRRVGDLVIAERDLVR
jgi:hypothetical protein